uniref:Putative HHH motif-containing secreted peptide n=1 Tax=Triatoma infestans TaxID=30076 RepID=A6YPP3_TRIIF|nr:putative HHH motif-containing secreted peptide [Triatoma infestans]
MAIPRRSIKFQLSTVFRCGAVLFTYTYAHTYIHTHTHHLLKAAFLDSGVLKTDISIVSSMSKILHVYNASSYWE